MKPKLRGLLVDGPNTEAVSEATVSVVFFLYIYYVKKFWF